MSIWVAVAGGDGSEVILDLADGIAGHRQRDPEPEHGRLYLLGVGCGLADGRDGCAHHPRAGAGVADVRACPLLRDEIDRSVVVAVLAVWVVQMARHEVVDVIAVRHRLMPAFGTVLMPRFVVGAVVLRSARGRVALADRNRMALDIAASVMVKLAVVQVVDVVIMAHRGVSAVRAVLVVVLIAHDPPFS